MLIDTEAPSVRALFPSLGQRVPGVWGVDEKRHVVMAGSLRDRGGVCGGRDGGGQENAGRMSGGWGCRRPWSLWWCRRTARVAGSGALLVEQPRDPDEPDARRCARCGSLEALV